MEDKYYTPSIEEFHVGFEYESFSVAGWVKCEYYEPTTDIFEQRLLTDIASPGEWYVDKNKIRVKYLNKEDIESLGIKLDKWQYGEFLKFNIGASRKINSGWLEYNLTTHKLIITTVDEGFNVDGPNYSIKFNGQCKNKSKLKPILKDIGI